MTTRATLRQEVAQLLGDNQSLTTSSSGSSTTVKDTSLKNLPGGLDCCAFENYYVLITSGSASGEEKRVSQYTASCAMLTVQEAFSATIASCVTYELHRHSVTDYHAAINDALVQVYPQIHKELIDETLVIDNLLSNADFETFASSNFTGWTATGSPTIVQETSLVLHGCSSAKLTAGGSGSTYYQDVVTNVDELVNKSVKFEAWVSASCACSVRLRLDWNGSCIDSSDYHSGDGNSNFPQWERLNISANVPSTATRIRATVDIAASKVAYIDGAWLRADRLYNYTVPSCFDTVNDVLIQANICKPNGEYIQLSGRPQEGHRLRLLGKKELSALSTDAGTTEVTEPQVRAIAALSARNLAQTLWQRASGDQRERYLEDLQYWDMQSQTELGKPGVRSRKKGANIYVPWTLYTDGSNQQLRFNNCR